jgi:hypothetical protein
MVVLVLIACSGCAPREQPSTLAAIEVPIPTGRDRTDLIKALEEFGAAEALHVDVATAQALEYERSNLPQDAHSTLRMGVWRGDKDRTRPVADLAPQKAKRDCGAMIERNDSFTDTFIVPGSAVRYDGTGTAEFGIVVHCWLDHEIAMHDCYVAFFGAEFPTNKPEAKPYLLRYAATSLARLDLPARNDR